MKLMASYQLSPSRYTLSCNDHRITSTSLQHSTKLRKQLPKSRPLMLSAYSNIMSSNLQVINERRSADYHPSIWDPKLIESITTSYTYDVHATRLEELKDEIKILLVNTKHQPLHAQLKLIDTIQRLGVAYNFQDEIKETLSLAQPSVNDDLETTALHFRLLRQNGFRISSDIFDKFRNKKGEFKHNLTEDVAGLMSLYEASYLGFVGEDNLEEAKSFSREHLLKSLVIEAGSSKNMNNIVGEQVEQALQVPLHWRSPRLEARNFIDVYQRHDHDEKLLELAKLDYNLVQSVYQSEVKELARWWRDLNFKKVLPFSRDRLVENYLWSVGMIFEPHLSKCRIGLTKFVCILSAIDDMYDIYASLHENELFTDAVNRWECEAMMGLPEYMQPCYLAMFNFGNELVQDVLTHQGFNILPYIRKAWADLCGAYLREARWYNSGYTPTLEEYLENSWVSVGGPSAIVHAYTLLGEIKTQNSLDSDLNHASELIHCSSLITRLSDDLGTSTAEMERGDVTKAIQCHMFEEGSSEKEAKEYVNTLISHLWKKINEEISANNSLPKSLSNMCLNMARIAQCIFQHGDGIGTSHGIIKDRLTSLIVQPIPFQNNFQGYDQFFQQISIRVHPSHRN